MRIRHMEVAGGERENESPLNRFRHYYHAARAKKRIAEAPSRASLLSTVREHDYPSRFPYLTLRTESNSVLFRRPARHAV